MKFENNWQFKTLENLQKELWPKMNFYSDLITRISNLRKVPLNEFSIEDLRIMISQNFGLSYLIIIAIDKLKEHVLVEGDLYPGDLLETVISVQKQFWIKHPDYKKQLQEIISDNFSLILNHNLNGVEGFLE